MELGQQGPHGGGLDMVDDVQHVGARVLPAGAEVPRVAHGVLDVRQPEPPPRLPGDADAPGVQVDAVEAHAR